VKPSLSVEEKAVGLSGIDISLLTIGRPSDALVVNVGVMPGVVGGFDSDRDVGDISPGVLGGMLDPRPGRLLDGTMGEIIVFESVETIGGKI
jgi:hypothetical protein